MITLHSYRRCPFAIRVRMVLEEKAIPYTIKEERLSDLSQELLSLHPEGRVPLLIEECGEEWSDETHTPKRQVIYQSSIITEYLEDRYPTKTPLMPQSAQDRAQVRLWTYWCDTLFKPELDRYKYELATFEEDKAKQLVTLLHDLLNHWDTALENKDFLVGSSFSLADIHLFPFARQFAAIQQPNKPLLPISLSDYKNLHTWLDRIISRPAFAAVMKK